MGLHRYLKYGVGEGLLYPLYLHIHQKPIYDSGSIFSREMCPENYSMVLFLAGKCVQKIILWF